MHTWSLIREINFPTISRNIHYPKNQNPNVLFKMGKRKEQNKRSTNNNIIIYGCELWSVIYQSKEYSSDQLRHRSIEQTKSTSWLLLQSITIRFKSKPAANDLPAANNTKVTQRTNTLLDMQKWIYTQTQHNRSTVTNISM